jgi:hypothetical protein
MGRTTKNALLIIGSIIFLFAGIFILLFAQQFLPVFLLFDIRIVYGLSALSFCFSFLGFLFLEKKPKPLINVNNADINASNEPQKSNESLYYSQIGLPIATPAAIEKTLEEQTKEAEKLSDKREDVVAKIKEQLVNSGCQNESDNIIEQEAEEGAQNLYLSGAASPLPGRYPSIAVGDKSPSPLVL